MSARTYNYDPSAILRAVGLRVTEPRVAVLNWLHLHPHSTADFLAMKVRSERGSVSTQAVYDVLRVCEKLGLIRKIEPAGSSALYETRTGDNHHHLVCRTCSQVFDTDCVVGHAPCLSPSELSGFVIDEAEVVFWGQCARCHGNQEPQH
ncbi:MAG: Fur family transcriptional regulator [Mycobacteriaceae bacterium]